MKKRVVVKTTAQEIQAHFLVMLVLMALIMGGAIFSTVGYQLVKQSEQNSRILIKSLKRSIINERPDWNYWQKSSPIDTKDTYVRVYKEHANQRTSTFYSANAHKFIQRNHYRIPIFTALQYTPGYGLTYYRSGQREGFYTEIWLNLAPITVILASVLVVTIVVAILMIGLGWVYVRRTAEQITRPLANLNVAAHEQTHTQSFKATLPVPERPIEVRQLAISFNELLTAINQKARQEREFTSNAAHELRTPIAAIRGHVQLLERRADAHPEIIPRSIQFIDEESARMQKLVNSLLTLSRADRGTLKLDYFDLSAIVDETVAEERAVLHQSLIVNSAHSAIIFGNSESVQQILSALIDNAGKYAPAGQPIIITVQVLTQTIQLTVADQGIGIADDDKQRIFERFFRVDSARTREVGGTGLGLAIVAQLIQLNRATITVVDNQPKGSQFVIQFPQPKLQSENLSD